MPFFKTLPLLHMANGNVLKINNLDIHINELSDTNLFIKKVFIHPLPAALFYNYPYFTLT
jgi:hypothetical protein